MQHSILRTLLDMDLNDGLLRHQVDALFSRRSSLYTSMCMGMVITVCAWIASGDNRIALTLFAHAIVGVARVSIVESYRAQQVESRSRSSILRYDRAFFALSAIYALLIGYTCAVLVVLPADNGSESLAVGTTVGFAFAFVARSSGRIRVAATQVVLVIAPVLYVYIEFPMRNAPLIVASLLGLVIACLVMVSSAHATICEVYQANARIWQMATTDALTGLLNRTSFLEALQSSIDQTRKRNESSCSVHIVDLDRFKDINDTLGHQVGDAVIIEMAHRIRDVAGPENVVARLGGDEFIILERGKEASLQPTDFAEILVAAFRNPIPVSNLSIPTTISVGCARMGEGAQTAQELMQYADIALYEAKRNGRNCARVFDISMKTHLDQIRQLESEIENAIACDQIGPWFQPICNLKTGTIVGYEALARWRHPLQGVIPPSTFIPIAEQAGSIGRLGAHMLIKSTVEAAKWSNGAWVSVNVSAVQFRNSEELVRAVEDALDLSGLPANRLILEITEGLMVDDSPQTRRTARRLTELGVKLALDDFGTGYSSLSYIRSYPFSKIKIDKKFVDHVETDRASSAVIHAVQSLSKCLDMELVAEGIETHSQLRALIEQGIEYGQGYLFGTPQRCVSATQFAPSIVQPGTTNRMLVA